MSDKPLDLEWAAAAAIVNPSDPRPEVQACIAMSAALDSAAASSAQQAGDAKTVANLQARAALAGFELVRLADGEFICSRWGLFRNLATIAEVEAFLRRVGASA